jgi:hypothetical protein
MGTHPKIQYREGDLFDFVPSQCEANQTIYLCHVCNSVGAWGAGFVLPLARHFPLAKEEYLRWSRGKSEITPSPFELGTVQFVDFFQSPRIVVCNMIGQELGGVRPLRYNALVACMDQVAKTIAAEISFRNTQPVIHCPFFGTALAGGNFAFIEKIIEDCWLRKNIPVTIHYLPGQTPEGWELPNE